MGILWRRAFFIFCSHSQLPAFLISTWSCYLFPKSASYSYTTPIVLQFLRLCNSSEHTDHFLCRMWSPPQKAMVLDRNDFHFSTDLHKWVKSRMSKQRSWPYRCFLRSLRSLFIRAWKKSHGGLTVTQTIPLPVLSFVVWISYNKPVFRGGNRCLGWWWIKFKALLWMQLQRKYGKRTVADLHLNIGYKTSRRSPSCL